MTHYYSNGKLLITGEYTVLDGALALAIPTKFGQSLTVSQIPEKKIIWKSLNHLGEVWFEGEFSLDDFTMSKTSNNDISKRLVQILNVIKTLNPELFSTDSGYEIVTKLDFSRNWGLGSSSTLINNLANWAKIDAYRLLELTFGGSGYDIACAQNNKAITYQIKNSKRKINTVSFNPEFKDNLYFVHLNKKKNSREGINQYNKNKEAVFSRINDINTITKKLIDCSSLEDFNKLIELHETITSSIIKQPTVKESFFKDFNGSIKSLGAWGGDFILVSSYDNPTEYFKNKGYSTIIRFREMVLT